MNNNINSDKASNESVNCAGAPAREPGALPGREEASAPGDLTLSTAHIRPRLGYYSGASVLTSTKGVQCEAVGGGKRGKIAGFSHNSRLRLMRLIGMVRRDAELPCFVTLTYPDVFPSVQRAKRDLKVFIQRLTRRFPAAGFIWKLEPQQRGAPHYHLMVWGVNLVELLPWVISTWYQVAGDGDIKHFKFHAGRLPGSKPCVEKVRSFRGVWSYASKYLGKTFEVAEWGNLWTGRFWGVGNRAAIPFGEYREVEVSMRWVVRCMRFQRRFSRVKSRQYNSLTTFCNADHWIDKLSLYPHI